jgi:HprK-related kinase A
VKLLDLNQGEIAHLLRNRGLRVQIGPFAVSLRSRLRRVAAQVAFFYAYYPLLADDEFMDFHIQINNPTGLRHWIRPQAIFSFDGFSPFKPLPEDQAFAMFEWGLNWCIATASHQYLIVHAAVVAKNGQGIILSGEPGAGKSTLCAALVSRGWRLLSDEMALIDPRQLGVTPVPRPIGLKNESIDIMKAYAGGMLIGPSVTDTAKGTVAHMRPPTESITDSSTDVHPSHILFPLYSPEAATDLRAVGKAHALTRIAEQSFNYHILGEGGFVTLNRLASTCPVFDLRYSQLESAIAEIDNLVS